MIRGKKTITLLATLVLCVCMVAVAVAKYEPPRTAVNASPNATSDPNWDLKQANQAEHQDGYVPLVVGEQFVAPPATQDELFRAAANSLSNVTTMQPGSAPILRDCPTVCPPNGIEDGEACGDDTNGGCNMTVPAFTSVACGDTVCGTIWADGGSRDTDWFELVLSGPAMVTWYAEMEFDGVIGFVDTSDCALASALDPYLTIAACGTGSVSRICGPGTYWLFVSHQTYYDVPCGTDNDYWATASCVPLTEGACCDPATGDCLGPLEEADCLAEFGGTGVWHAGETCSPNPCPPPAGPGDSCEEPLTFTLPGDLPYESKNNYTCGRQNLYDAGTLCNTSYGGGEDAVYEMTVTTATAVDMTFDPKGTTWSYFEVRTDCPPSGDCVGYASSSGGTVVSLLGVALDAGTYYIVVDTWPTPDCIPDFDLTITEADMGEVGDNCLNPLPIGFGLADLPYTVANETTCGRGNNYANTCLGSYDGGEDIIIEVTPTEDMSVDVTVDPKGTTYAGVGMDNVCPLSASGCMGYVTNSSAGTPFTLYNMQLTAGQTYYVMVDTWPSPDCIPDLDVTFSLGAGGPENDDCADAIAIGDVTDLAFSTAAASFDGSGACQTAPNVWYCYTATCDGELTASLCGSSYDTKMAVYDGCDCSAPMLACNDDACGLQSEVSVPCVAGNQYLIEVGGYSSSVGDGVLTTSCYVPPPPPYNDLCENAIVQTDCPVTITGTNESSTNESPDCFGDCGHAWEAFTLTENKDVAIDLCGTDPAFELVYISLYDVCPQGAGCEPILADATDWDLCGDGNVTMYFYNLPAGTYYLPMLACYAGYESYYMEGPYTVHIECQDPTYCPGSGGCDEYIENVLLEDIDNTTGCDGYGDYTALSTILEPGGTYPMSVTLGSAYSLDAVAVWIDFDHSLSFDADEVVLTGGPDYGPFTGDVNVPGDALTGDTRMRVRLVYNLDPTEYACGSTTYGEVEDYTVDIECFPSDSPVGVSVDPMYMYYAFQIDPYMIDVYICPENDGSGVVSDIDLNSIQVNGHAAPGTTGPAVLGFSCGETCYCNMWIYDFMTPYGAPLGFQTVTYNVTGDWVSSGSFVYSGDVGLYGKDPYRPSMWIVPPDQIIVRADCDRSGFVNISDATYLLQFIFNNGEAPMPRMVADADCNLMVNVTDAVFLINYIFAGGPTPCPVGE